MKQILLLALFVCSVLLLNPAIRSATAMPPAADLFISEYIEGAATGNKAIEIYNGTAAPVDLAAGNYVLQLYVNGSATASQSFNLDGTIAVGDVYVVSRNDAAPAILAQIDVAAPTVINFTGDDAIVLRKGGTAGTILDVIGQVGFDPGTEWGTGLTSTADNTLTRKSTICGGDAIAGNAFDPATEWDGFPTDTFTSIGSHTASCGETTPPSISYTNLSNTTGTGNRVLSAAISDNVAVASGAVAPRIYFRKNAGSYVSTQCSLVSGNTQSGTYDCTIDNTLIGGVVPGDQVSYFVIAQDTSGNITSSPSGAVATNVNTVTTAPTPNSYSIIQTFAGTLSVGAGQAITSLTNNGGLFQALNAGTISGNLTVNITSDLTAETGTHALNQLTETGAGGYTIFFQASGGTRLIEGSSVNGIITLNGADRVTFSGLAFGPNGLTIRNLGNGQAFRFTNDATSNAIRNCAVEADLTAIFFGNGNLTGNDDNSVSDSFIRARNSDPMFTGRAILSRGDPTPEVRNSNLLVDRNTIVDGVVELLDADNFTISENSLSQTGTRLLVTVIGADRSAGSNLITRNSISNFIIDGIFDAIGLGEVGTTTVSRNRIFNIEGTTDPSFTSLAGITLIGSTVSPTSVAIENNTISLAPSIDVQGQIYGIHDRSNAGDSVTVVHNTILLSGPTAGSPESYGFLRNPSTPSAVSLLNNIFFNGRGTGPANYAIGDMSPGQGTWSSDYNLYVGRGSVAAEFFLSGSTPTDFATWESGPPARDANSIAGVVNTGPFNVANMFTSASDLHLNVSGFNPAINAGTNAGVSSDYDGQTRPFNGTPDIGADEVQTVPTAAEASIGGRVVTAAGRGISNVRLVVSGGSLTEPRVLMTSAFGYYRIDGLQAGETYVISAASKRYLFETPVRAVSLGEDALGVDFIGQPR